MLARELEIDQVVVPVIAGALCAIGEATAHLRYDSIKACPEPLSALDPDVANRLFGEMQVEGFEALAVTGNPPSIRIQRYAEMKYVDQIHYCDVSVPEGTLDAKKIEELRGRFHKRHEELFTYCEHDNEPEILSFRCSVIIEREHRTTSRAPHHQRHAKHAPTSERKVLLPGVWEQRSVPIYDGALLEPGVEITGPAIIDEETTTIFVPSGDRCILHTDGFFLISIAA
jgi:N-methylhydantoinase A